MLYLLPNPGNPPKKGPFRPRKVSRKITKRGPGLPISSYPTVLRPPARRAHPASKTRGGRKIRKALGGKGPYYRHRIVYWSKDARGGTEGVRSPYYVKGNRMARRVKGRRRKYSSRRRRKSNPLVMGNRRHRRKGRRKSRRNPYVLGNRSRRRSHRKGGRRRRNAGFVGFNPDVLFNRKRRRKGRRSRRNPYVLGNRKRRRSRRGGYRRNPGSFKGALSLLKPANFLAGAKSFALQAVPVGAGYVGVRLLDSYLYSKAWGKLIAPLNAKMTGEIGPKLLNTAWDTLTHIVTAGVGGGLISKVWKKPDAAKLFAAGVAVNWIRKMAVIWLPEGQFKAALAGYEGELEDYVENTPRMGMYGNDSMSDYVESNPGMRDYVTQY